MREYVPALAKEALAALSKRWEFTPKGPILIEMFPKHDDFAVRNLGLPGMIGALGACFGRVVTLDSPKARPPGDFNWGATLWHEMAHVITLQLSNQRIPRWLTEGISVFEEKRARPEWGREMEVAFARALEDGRSAEAARLNAGFQNPQTISLAYYEASLLVEHIVEKHGEPALRALVKSFADGIDTEGAIVKVLSSDIDALQGTFDGFLDERFGALRAALTVPEGFAPDAPLEKLQGRGRPASRTAMRCRCRSAGRCDRSDQKGAIEAFERASKLVPMMTGPESPYMQIVEVAMASGDKARAAQALDAMTAQDHTAIDAARQLVGLLDPEKDKDRLKVALQRVVAVDPFDAPAHSTLGRIALAGGQPQEAVRAFRVALAGGPLDRASAHADLAESLLQTGNKAEAQARGAGGAGDCANLRARAGYSAQGDGRSAALAASRSYDATPRRPLAADRRPRRGGPAAGVAGGGADAVRAGRTLRRPPVDLRAHQIQLQRGRRAQQPARRLLGRAVGDRRAGGGAEPHPARAIGHRDRSDGADRAHPGRREDLAVSVALSRRAEQSGSEREGRRDRSASTCCAAAP